MKYLGALCALFLIGCLSCGGDTFSVHQQELAIVERYPIGIELVPGQPQQIYEKGCWVDDDCNDCIDCTGREWCCGWDEYLNGIDCEQGECYKGLSPCGQPISAIMAICDLEWDTCRGCRTDEECNVDTHGTHVNWNWCGGPRRCGGENENYHFGVCLGTGEGFPCEWYEICNPEEQQCNPRPECRNDSDCPGLEAWCSEDGKCME